MMISIGKALWYPWFIQKYFTVVKVKGLSGSYLVWILLETVYVIPLELKGARLPLGRQSIVSATHLRIGYWCLTYMYTQEKVILWRRQVMQPPSFRDQGILHSAVNRQKAVTAYLKVIYHTLYSMNNFVTNKSKLPQDGAQVFPYMGWLAIMWPSVRVTW